jgi:hypothetical protein
MISASWQERRVSTSGRVCRPQLVPPSEQYAERMEAARAGDVYEDDEA